MSSGERPRTTRRSRYASSARRSRPGSSNLLPLQTLPSLHDFLPALTPHIFLAIIRKNAIERVMLYIFGGLPGTGKSTLSQHLAREQRAVHLRIDTIEQALREAGCLVNGPEGYN